MYFCSGQPMHFCFGVDILVRDAGKEPVTKLVYYDGTDTDVAFEPSEVLAYARKAAKEFGVGGSRTVEFDAHAANAAIKELREEGSGKPKKGGKRKQAA
jgi:hypothetical protein